jgi:hypothetical protein
MRVSVLFLALLGVGCPGSPDANVPPEIDLSEALEHEEEGNKVEAVRELADLVEQLVESGRTDVRAHAAWARILGSLRRLKVGAVLAQAPPETRQRCKSLEPWLGASGPSFLCAGIAGHWARVLSLGAEAPVLAEAAATIADILSEKVDDPTLRRGRVESVSDLSERLYRRSLVEAASEYARYALSRVPAESEQTVKDAVTRSTRLLRRLGRELRELSELPGVLPEAANRWQEHASRADAAALALRSEKGGAYPVTNELRQDVEIDSTGLLKAATASHNKANDLLIRRADAGETLDALERALRHYVAARECLVEPTALQKRELNVMANVADSLRSLAFEN